MMIASSGTRNKKLSIVVNCILLLLCCFVSLYEGITYHGVRLISIGPVAITFSHLLLMIFSGLSSFFYSMLLELIMFLLDSFLTGKVAYVIFIYLIISVNAYLFSKYRWHRSLARTLLASLIMGIIISEFYLLVVSAMNNIPLFALPRTAHLNAFVMGLPECVTANLLLYLFYKYAPPHVQRLFHCSIHYTNEKPMKTAVLSKYIMTVIVFDFVIIVLVTILFSLMVYDRNADGVTQGMGTDGFAFFRWQAARTGLYDAAGQTPVTFILRFLMSLSVFAVPAVYLANYIITKLIIKPLLAIIGFMNDYAATTDEHRAEVAGRICTVEPRFHNELWQAYNALYKIVNSIEEYVVRLREKKKLEDELKIAEETSKAKTSFLSNMSHEIRTPINTVLGMDEMILRECTDNTILSYATNIKKSGTILLQLINDILDFSKIEAGKMELVASNYTIKDMVSDLHTMIMVRAKEKNLTLNVVLNPKIPSVLFGDEMKIKQCIINLLTNAVKYTNEGSVTFSVDFSKADDEHIILKISVSDTGIGILPQDMKKIFSPFERVDLNRNRSIEGAGLGMSIVKQLLTMMESKLQVQSVYGKGSEFSFAIKQKVVSWSESGEFAVSGAVSEGKKTAYKELFHAPDAHVLIVDDVELNRAVMVALLKNTQVQVDTAASGTEMLDLTNGKIYDVIFLDHRMPGMDGVEALHAMKSSNQNLNRHSPCIALTANVYEGVRDVYLKAGFDDYLSKPVNTADLEAMLMKYLPQTLVVWRKE